MPGLVPEFGGVSVMSSVDRERKEETKRGRQGNSEAGTRMWQETDGNRESSAKARAGRRV